MLTHEFPPIIGGIGTYAKELATAASELGHSVTVYAPSYHQSCGEDDGYPFEVRRFQGSVYHPLRLPALIHRTRKIIAGENADIVHAIDIPFAICLAYLGKRQNHPFMTSVHGAASMTIRGSSAARILGVTDAYLKAERIMANSSFTKKLLLEAFPGVTAERIVIAHLGVHPGWYKPVDAKAVIDTRHRFGIKPENKVILTVARLDRRKGHNFVFEAIERLPQEVQQNLSYVIVGEGADREYYGELKALASKCKAEVNFTGTLKDDDLRAVYAGATLFCMPGDVKPPGAEGFGLAYLEAAALGIPSVAFNIAALPEIIRDGETGCLVPHNDIGALSAAIGRLLTHTDEARKLGRAAKEWAAEFTWSRCARLTYAHS